MLSRKFLFIILSLICFFGTVVTPQVAKAETPGFTATGELAGYVDFWKLIFAKYGKHNAVFHFRDRPYIIYSVLDFNDLAKKHSEANLKKIRYREVTNERIKIQNALRNLAAGRSPKNQMETRIRDLFRKQGIDSRRYYVQAADRDQIRDQTGIKERFEQGLARSGRYLFAIEKIFEAKGLPKELGRLPLIESSFDYEAYSSVGAAGIWQFMRATAKQYMHVDSAIDERRDPIVASRAAAEYLAHSYKRTQNWPMAVTSYNHGLNGIMRAANTVGSKDMLTIIKRYNSPSFGFASKNFYVELLAAIDIEKNKFKYFPNLKLEREWHFDEIRLGRSASYRTLVSASGIGEADFAMHNKALLAPVRQGRVNVPAGFHVKVPQGRGTQLASAIGNSKVFSIDGANQHYVATYQEKKSYNYGQKYLVSPGDTIGGIAVRHGVSQRDLMADNGITDPRRLRVGQYLRIPVGGSAVRTSTTSRAQISQNGARKTYKVKSGDTLTQIGKKTGVRVSRLKQLNPSKVSKIFPGDIIYLN